MRYPAIAAGVALALGGVALPATAWAQQMPVAGAPDAGEQPAADPLAPLPQAGTNDSGPLTENAAQLTDWVIRSGDNGGLPFMVIDKVAAEVVAFDPEGEMVGATPALVGVTPGDDSAPGVGDRELSAIKPADRTTPAGRFVAKFGTDSRHHHVLWVDYTTAISLHPVITANKKERRLQRLKSPTPDDNRITYGCINVPPAFYGKIVRPLFKDTIGVVYILPETKALNEVFLAYQPQLQGNRQFLASH